MSCLISNNTVAGDNNNIIKDIVDAAINNISVHNKILALNYIYAKVNESRWSLATIVRTELNSIEDYEHKDKIESIISIDNIIESLTSNNKDGWLNPEHIIKAIIKHYNKTHTDVSNYNTVRSKIENTTFSSMEAEDISVNYVAELMSDMLHDQESSTKKADINTIYNRLRSQLFNMNIIPIYSRIENEILNSTDTYHGISIEKEIKPIIDAVKKYNDLFTIVKGFRKAADKIRYIKDNITTISEEFGIEVKDGDIEKPETISKISIAIEKSNAYKLYVDNVIKLIKLFGNEAEINQATIITDMNSARFRRRIMNSSKLYNYSSMLDNFDVFNDTVVDENDAYIYEAESVDESTKRWNERGKSNFMNYVNQDLKYRLSQIHKFSHKYDYSAKEGLEDIARYYDTSNIVGVPVRYNTQEVIKQLMAFGNFNSIDKFIESIQNISEINPFLYGFAEIVLEMKSNPMFANALWTALARPVSDRTTIIITEQGLQSTKTNANNTAFNAMVNRLRNDVKGHSSFYSSTHKKEIDAIKNKDIINNILDYILKGDKKGKQAYNKFTDLIRTYIPSISDTTIINAVKSGVDRVSNKKDNTNKELTKLEILTSFINNLSTIINAYEKFYKNIDNKRSSNDKSIKLTPSDFIFDINSNEVVKACIELATVSYKFEKSDIELNSYNAEGNLSSNMIDNCYLTRIFELMKNGNEEALISLGREIKDSPQYKFSPIYFGVGDIKGIFSISTNDVVTVNYDVINNLKYSLFDGIRTAGYTESSLYDGMHEGDYFLTMLQLYFNPVNDISITSTTEKKITQSDIFLPIPSDKPQNCMITMPRYTDGKVITVKKEVKDEIINNRKSIIDKQLGIGSNPNMAEYFNGLPENVRKSILKAIDNKRLYKVTLNDLENLFFTENPDYISAGINITYENKKYRAAVYEYDGDYHLIFIDSNNDTTKNDKENEQEEEESKIVFNPKVVGYTMLTKNTKKSTDGKVITEYIPAENIERYIGDKLASHNLNKSIEDLILKHIEEGTVSDDIFNVESSVAKQALVNNVKTEIYTMIATLNDLFTNKDGNIIKLRDDTQDLISPYHYSDKKDVIAKDGKLTGRAFSFDRLFDITFNNGKRYSANEELMNIVSLYGVDGIIKNGTNGLYIDTTELGNNGIVKFDEETGTFKVDFTANIESEISRIVDTWMNYFAHSVVENYTRFADIINENGYTYENVIESMIGNVISLQGLNDLIYGNEKFYADSRTFFKRAKEALAGGDAYAFIDMNRPDGISLDKVQKNDNIAKQLQDFLTFEIDINGTKKKINVFDNYETEDNESNKVTTNFDTNITTNGWNAITIKNVVNTIEDNQGIYELVYNSIIKSERVKQNIIGETPQSIKTLAQQIAHNIATKFGYKDGAKTKVDDAQSYITFEEWCKRRVADGTIGEYKDIIQQIMEVRYGLKKPEDVNFRNIDARIQVEKNYYYDVKTSKFASGNIRNPRQIKNAEFVLIPEFIKGTDLYELYKIMRTNGIGQVNTVETSKASHTNVLQFWDNDGNIKVDEQGNPTIISELKNNANAIEEFSYKYLYKQLRVAQHMVDETNKAGIQLMKKLADNATDETRRYIDEFMKNYVANIKTSFDELLIACGWKYDNGKIVDNTGVDIKYDYFMEKAKKEAIRLGLDSNFADFFECDANTGKPIIPVWLNDSSNKMESIVGGIFNSMITRQKLPGFHAAQVTGVGFGNSLGNGTSVAYSKKLRYNPVENGEKLPYIEIMIPRNSKVFDGMTDEQINEAIAKGNVNEMIVYRMPTEGKHSVAVAKVVAVTPEVFGSTIILPHGWVTQTGSDFDVDSVYAVNYHVKKDKKGNIVKVVEDKLDTVNDRINAYGRYVRRQMSVRREKGFESEMTEVTRMYNEMLEESKKIDSFREDYGEALKSYNEYMDNLYMRYPIKRKENGTNPRIEITKIINDIKNSGKVKFITTANGKTRLDSNNDNVIKYYNLLADKIKNNENISDDVKNNIIDKITAIVFSLSALDATIGITGETKSQMYETKLKTLNNIAERFGIISFDEFNALPDEYKWSKEVRDNKILDSMINIMKSISSAEERFSCSNFDDITEANKYVAELTGRSVLAESPYNPLTQIKYFNDATSGMALKGKSVSRDTGLSLFNYMKAELTYDIPVIYNTDGSIKGNPVYNESIIKLAYKDNMASTDKGVLVRHNKLGYSKNNRNVVGKILTEYGSQTTAHILDAIKEGPIRNETLFTFDAFKLLIDTGVDYTTAISWLATNGIQLICDKDANTESIYTKSVGNPVHRALRQLCIDNSIIIKGKLVNEFTPYNTIIEYFENPKNTTITNIKTKLGYSTLPSDKTVMPYPIITNNLHDRLNINSDMTEEEKLVMDYITIRQFEFLDRVAKNVIKLQQVSNPDKFGAKQTLYESNDVLNKIEEYRESSNNGKNIGNTVVIPRKIAGKTVFDYYVDALYPLNPTTGEIDVDRSRYPFMAGFLKYSTIPSVELSKGLFELDALLMDDDKSYNTQKELIGRRFSNEEFKEFKKYLVKYLYSDVKELITPITVDATTGQTIINEEETNTNAYYYYTEIARLRGTESIAYQKDAEGRTFNPNTFSVDDIDNPTQEEINDFAKLIPSKKIAFITKTFKNAGIFSKIFVVNRNTTSEQINIGQFYQELRINTENESIEDLFDMFKQMITSSNPIIKLTALDLVKYSYIVEGRGKKRGNITNIVSNYAITDNNIFFDGRSLLTGLIERFNELNSEEIDNIYSQFIRANSEIVPIKNTVTKRSSKFGRGSIWEYRKGYNSFYIPLIYTDRAGNIILDKDGNPKINEEGREIILNLAREYNQNIQDNDANPAASIPTFIRLRHKVPVYKEDKNILNEDGTPRSVIERYEFINQLFSVTYNQPNDLVLGVTLRGVSLLDKDEVNEASTNESNNYRMYGDKRINFVYEGHAQLLIDKIQNGSNKSFNIANSIIKANKEVGNPYLTPDFINDALKSDINHIRVGAEEIVKVVTDSLVDNDENTFGYTNSVRIFASNSRMEYMAKHHSAKSKSIIEIDGVKYAVWVTENSKSTNQFRKWLESGKDSATYERIKQRSENGIKNPTTSKLYSINYQNIGNGNVAYSASETIEYNEDVQREDSPFEQMKQAENTASRQTYETVNFISEILSDIVNNRHHADNEFATRIKKYINTNHIKPESIHDIETYRKQLMSLIKEYYENRSAYFMSRFDDYLENGTNMGIDSDAMIEYLKEDDSRFNEFIKFLLEARNFGRSAKEYSSAIATGNKELDSSINDILNAVSKVLSSSKLNTSFRRVFNDYIAMRWSDNPNVRLGILDISVSFKDSSLIDSWISSIYEIGNKEVQVIVNRVENLFSQVSQLIIPEQQDIFNERYDQIMASGAVNMEKIIDSSTGKFIRPFNDSYVEDKKKIDNAVIVAGQARDIARNNYYTALENEESTAQYAKEYETALINYAKADLAKSKWYAKYVEQPIVKEYYDEVNAYKEAILYNDFVEEYGKYLRLTEELSKLRGNKQHYTIEESEQIHTIKEAIRTIVNPAAIIVINNKRFPVEEIGRPLTVKEQEQVNRINAQRKAFEELLRAKKNITEKYFDFEPSKDWIITRDRYINIVEEFDAKNPDMDIEQKLRNAEYANAYSWLRANTIRSLGKKQQAIMNNYLSVLNSNKDVNSAVNKIIREAGAFDEFGNVDPTKLSDEDIQKINTLYTKHYERMAQHDETARLIKDVPASAIMKKAYHDLFAGLVKKDNAERDNIIKGINEILSKGLDKQTNSIRTELLWANTTVEERRQLARLYGELRNVKGIKENREIWEDINKHVVRVINEEAYNREKNYAKRNLTGEELRLWDRIFSQIDENGFPVVDKKGNHVGNPYIYGYNSIRKEEEFNIYVDEEKTAAIRWISNNTRTVVTDKYRNAEIKARRKGSEYYNKWFELNHIYNPITHKYEPLRIWTTFEAKVGISKAEKESLIYNDDTSFENVEDFFTEEDVVYGYEPTFEHNHRIIKQEYINKPNGSEYKYTNTNYRENHDGVYTNKDIAALTEAERNMLDLLTEYTRKYAVTDKAKRFTEQGYVPREYITPVDARYVAKQAASLVGVDYIPSNKSWYDVSYNDDILPPQDMYDIIKTKGYKQYMPYIEKPMVPNEENMRVYNETIEEIKKKNEEIRKHNLELEKNYRSKDYKKVFNSLIASGEEYKVRQDSKNLLFLLIEDFKANDETYSNKANRRNTRTGKILSRNKKNITGKKYLEEEQKNTLNVLINYARRRLYGQYKQPHQFASIANMLQGITSAKYMYMNIPGGFANVYTGFTNIMNEAFGKDYIDHKYLREALYEYLVKDGGCLSYISDWWSADKVHSKNGAIIDLFQVVDYDRILNRESGEDISTYISRVREIMYSPQSMGEHFMQNTVLLAMLKSHRLYEVTDFRGKKVLKCGDFYNYTWNIEQQAMLATINKIATETEHKDIVNAYYEFIESKRSDINELEKLDRFATNINDEFLRTFGNKYEEYANTYIGIKKDMLKNAKKKFEANQSLYDQYEFVDGKLKIKADSVLVGKDGKLLPYYGADIFGKFRNKVISVNEKIHGVYSRIGAAQIEKYWYGGLVMQYHKHIYPGFMKRFRGLFSREFYSEFRDSVEKGSYVSLYQLLTKELRDVKNKVTNKKDVEAITTLDYINETLHALVTTFTNFRLNYNMMSVYDQINVRRTLGDLLGIVAAFMLSVAIFAGTDDDDLKESNVLSTALYIADRCYSEAIMYTPYGIYVEGKTLWSSPIAMTNSIEDVTKIAFTTMSILFDEDFNPYYTTGQYRGEHKIKVAALRNVPVYRVYNRLSRMTKNNKYYRLGDTGITKFARTTADYINPD
jgi:hypothetical protein